MIQFIFGFISVYIIFVKLHFLLILLINDLLNDIYGFRMLLNNMVRWL
jgi:hypothetical protein